MDRIETAAVMVLGAAMLLWCVFSCGACIYWTFRPEWRDRLDYRHESLGKRPWVYYIYCGAFFGFALVLALPFAFLLGDWLNNRSVGLIVGTAGFVGSGVCLWALSKLERRAAAKRRAKRDRGTR